MKSAFAKHFFIKRKLTNANLCQIIFYKDAKRVCPNFVCNEQERVCQNFFVNMTLGRKVRWYPEKFQKQSGVFDVQSWCFSDLTIWQSDCFKKNDRGKSKNFSNFKTPNSLFEQTTAWKYPTFFFGEKVTHLPTVSHVLFLCKLRNFQAA